MRIEIESFEELHELVRLFAAGYTHTGESIQRPVKLTPAEAGRTLASANAEVTSSVNQEYPGLVERMDEAIAGTSEALRDGTIGETSAEADAAAAHAEAQALVDGERAKPAEGAELDDDGTPWDERIHSNPAKRNKVDGSWRARRGVDKAQAAVIAADLREALARAQKVDGDAEPAATETHPLPTASPGDVVESTVEEPTAEILDLVESAKLIAGDVQQDSLIHVLTACKAFIVEQGMPRFELLKKAVAGDLVVQQYTPADCRLMLAAISLHQPGGAA